MYENGIIIIKKKNEQMWEMHVIHTWILMNKEYILLYILALSKGHENQANILNTFSTYIYKKHPWADLEG